jgi:hypothetical protein
MSSLQRRPSRVRSPARCMRAAVPGRPLAGAGGRRGSGLRQGRGPTRLSWAGRFASQSGEPGVLAASPTTAPTRGYRPIVVSAVERRGRIRASVVKNRGNAQATVRAFVLPGAMISPTTGPATAVCRAKGATTISPHQSLGAHLRGWPRSQTDHRGFFGQFKTDVRGSHDSISAKWLPGYLNRVGVEVEPPQGRRGDVPDAAYAFRHLGERIAPPLKRTVRLRPDCLLDLRCLGGHAHARRSAGG